MAETAIAAALSKFGELATREAKILLEVGDNMTLLRDRLEWLQAFIRDADRRRRAGTGDQLTRVWVRQTRDVSFEAEDTLDEALWALYERWCKHFNAERDHDEMARRFSRFKETVLRVRGGEQEI